MGDEQGQGGLGHRLTGQQTVGQGVYFLDENHCRNPYMIDAIERRGLICEKHLDHFAPGTPDTDWLPIIARHGWALITTDARIRTNLLEREAVRINRARMFYFSRNNLAGQEMGAALGRALPQMQTLVEEQRPPFTASISKRGEVRLRDTFYVEGGEP